MKPKIGSLIKHENFDLYDLVCKDDMVVELYNNGNSAKYRYGEYLSIILITNIFC